MSLAVIFLLTAVTGCVLASVSQQRLKHGGSDAQEDEIEGLVGRMRELEDIVRKQAQLIGKIEVLEDTVKKQVQVIGKIEVLEDTVKKQVQVIGKIDEMVRKQAKIIEDILSEKQLWLTEKQPLKTSVEIQEMLSSPADDIFEGDGIAIEKEAVRQSLQLGDEIIGSQKQKGGVFVRSDDSDPLLPVVAQLTEKVNQVSAGLQALKNEMTETSTSVFVNWGSSTCPNSAVRVYSGEVGGSHYTSPGAAANYLCLPLSNVTLVDITVNNYAQLYGGEYETADEHYQKDPVCAVCRSSRANNVMIPATTVCPAGWTSEYSGWLMAGNPPHNAASEFICVDSKMEERIGSDQDNNGKLMYYTSTVCGSLPCPPYVNGKRVTCVVCSK